ncbi:hypothetical protein [Pedobacter sp. GR22-6]|uniref:hypothetical protein n=1 Tax=Pedobacter sp. GR22-6 TaxID=3127957 RepID=UPI00307DDE5D
MERLMRNDKQIIDPLKKLLQDHGTISPSEGFSKRLLNAVITGYRLNYSRAYKKQERLGKGIIAILIITTLVIFVELRPTLETMEMIVPIVILAIGLLSLILMFRKLFSAQQ